MKIFPTLIQHIIAIAITLGLSGCVYVSDGRSPAFRPGLIPLYSATVENDGVHIVADSHGCTSLDSFQTVIFRDGGNPDSTWYHVRFERLNVDMCDEFIPGGIELIYTFTRLGLPSNAHIIIDNPRNL